MDQEREAIAEKTEKALMQIVGHTPGPWDWEIHDHSMATLDGPRGLEDHVMSVSPCSSCQKDETEWEFGRCTTPTIENARLLKAAPDLASFARYWMDDAKLAWKKVEDWCNEIGLLTNTIADQHEDLRDLRARDEQWRRLVEDMKANLETTRVSRHSLLVEPTIIMAQVALKVMERK